MWFFTTLTGKNNVLKHAPKTAPLTKSLAAFPILVFASGRMDFNGPLKPKNNTLEGPFLNSIGVSPR